VIAESSQIPVVLQEIRTAVESTERTVDPSEIMLWGLGQLGGPALIAWVSFPSAVSQPFSIPTMDRLIGKRCTPQL